MAAQQLNLADRLKVRDVILPRCTAAVANYALYILGEDAQIANHVNRLTWAREAIQRPDVVAQQASWFVLNQNEFLDAGSSIADATLTGIIESAINSRFITPA